MSFFPRLNFCAHISIIISLFFPSHRDITKAFLPGNLSRWLFHLLSSCPPPPKKKYRAFIVIRVRSQNQIDEKVVLYGKTYINGISQI